MAIDESRPSSADGFAIFRSVFGVFWLFNLFVRLQDLMLGHFMRTLAAQTAGEPGWLRHYVLWVYQGIDAIGRLPVGILMAAVSAALAGSLLGGGRLRLGCWPGIGLTRFPGAAVGASPSGATWISASHIAWRPQRSAASICSNEVVNAASSVIPAVR